VGLCLLISFILEIKEIRTLIIIVGWGSTICIGVSGLVSLGRFLLCFNIDSWISTEIFTKAQHFSDTT
jgi:hypothetical protein